MQDKYKILSFIIATKRLKKNSAIKKNPKYITCKQFGLSVNTYCKYLKTCIDSGFIREVNGYYITIPLKEIITKVFKGSGKYFSKTHKILNKKLWNSSEFTSVDKIEQELLECLVKDNIIDHQQTKIKQRELHFAYCGSSTGTVQKALWYKLPHKKRYKLHREFQRHREKYETSNNVNQVVTSARHLSIKLGISPSKANKVLNNLVSIKRDIQEFFVKGSNEGIYNYLRLQYPKAVIIPCHERNRTKVCFGSVLSLNSTRNPL